MTARPLLVCALLTAGAACRSATPQEMPDVMVSDPHSFARPAAARVTHLALDLSVDFAHRRLVGTARLSIARANGARDLVLDSRGLGILGVTDGRGVELAKVLGPADPVLGQSLTITLPASTNDIISVTFATTPESAALQWLDPDQTAGKQRPFLFTQGQAILTRTWIPTQDSPGIRQTYEAIVRVPEGMRAVMSAEREGEPRTENGETVFRFRMTHAIPPYLIALAVGDVDFRAIGPRSGVYAEPSVLAAAAHEFAEVDAMIDAAERLYGPYRWGRYEVLVLPPSFPYGGMENPCVTFATPTILAGDRSLVSLVAHELAHSWSGNLVTNATWNDFWINEGFTTYIERRIMEALRGRGYADMLLQLGRQDLATAIAEAGGPQAPDTRLRLDLAGRDPDEGTTNIAYEKGSLFLQTIEAVVGRERLDTFLRAYFDRFAFQPMTAERLLQFMDERLFRPGEAQRIDVQAWVYAPGVPANAPVVRAAAFDVVDAQVAAWTGGAPASAVETTAWSTHEWLHFLRALPKAIPRARLDDLDRVFRLSTTGNSEVLFAWLEIAIRTRYEPAFPALERFLTSQGRRKFVRPLYQQLANTTWGREMALKIYARARPTYHAVTATSVDQILK